MGEVSRCFLPWLRAGNTAELTGVPAAGRARADLPFGVRLRGDGGLGRIAVPSGSPSPATSWGSGDTLTHRGPAGGASRWAKRGPR